jgi:hypothetical protein
MDDHDRVVLAPSELKELVYFATSHAKKELGKLQFFSYLCDHDVTIWHADGGGIGTRTLVKCGCGVERDITDYTLW